MTTMATAAMTTTTTTMAADDDDKEVDGDGTRRSFRGGTIKALSSRMMAKVTTLATVTTMMTTMSMRMVADDNDKEVNGDGTRHSFWGGTKRHRRRGSREGHKEGGVIVVVAVVRIVGVNDGDVAFLLGGGAIEASPLRES